MLFNRGMKIYPLNPEGAENPMEMTMPFTLSQNTAREIQSAFESFQASEFRLAGSFADDMQTVHIPAAKAYSFLRAEAEAAGVSLSSSSLWKGTSFAGKDYKDYRAFMSALCDNEKEIIELISDRKLNSWLSALQTWKKANRETKEKQEESWEDALFKLLDKFNLDPIDVSEYLAEMVEMGNDVISSKSALDVAPLTVIDPAKMKIVKHAINVKTMEENILCGQSA
jgi:hypothetical protein